MVINIQGETLLPTNFSKIQNGFFSKSKVHIREVGKKLNKYRTSLIHVLF